MELTEFPTRDGVDEYDWAQVFPDGDAAPTFHRAAPETGAIEGFGPEAVKQVEGFYADSPEGYGSCDLAALVELHDGRWASVDAWCDTTGWDCQSAAVWSVGTRDEVIRFGLTDENRQRLGIELVQADGKEVARKA